MCNWEKSRLEDILSVSSGSGLPQNKMVFGNHAVYGGNGINGFHNEYLFDDKRLIIGRVGEHCGNVHLTLPKSWITDNALIVSFIDKESDLDFWYYFLTYLDLKKYAFRGAQPVITGATVDKIDVYFPVNSSNQRKIAHILNTVDAVIEKTEATIAKYKAIKQGMLHDLFTRGIDLNTGKLRPKPEEAPHLYEDKGLGLMPRDWKVKKLGCLTEKIGSGITPTGGSEVYQKSGVLFIRSQNVLWGRLSLSDVAFISHDVDEMMASSRVKPFDVLLNITGASIGRCAYFPIELEKANVNQHVCILRFEDTSKELAIFASEFMNSKFGQSQIYRSNAGGNRDGLNFQQIRNFYFPEVKNEELIKISSVIERQNSKLEAETAYLNKLLHIKQGLMSDLLTGKKEIKVEKCFNTLADEL